MLREDASRLDLISIPPLALYTGREITERRDTIRRVYSLSNYGELLEAMYGKVEAVSAGKVTWLPTKNVLNQFLNPSRLNLLRA